MTRSFFVSIVLLLIAACSNVPQFQPRDGGGQDVPDAAGIDTRADRAPNDAPSETGEDAAATADRPQDGHDDGGGGGSNDRVDAAATTDVASTDTAVDSASTDRPVDSTPSDAPSEAGEDAAATADRPQDRHDDGGDSNDRVDAAVATDVVPGGDRTCTSGSKQCSGMQPQICDSNGRWQDDGPGCTGCSVCSMPTGTCIGTTGPSCSDNNACTSPDTCQAGVCRGGAAVSCPGADQCHTVAACVPSTGCPPAINKTGGDCIDNDPCTMNDTCQNGSCRGTPMTCSSPPTCRSLPGTCSAGSCTYPNAPPTTLCEAGLGTCQAGACDVPRFRSLGVEFFPSGISADGTIVVGDKPTPDSTERRGFHWRAGVTTPLLGPTGANDCYLKGISANGAVSVGYCYGPTPTGNSARPVRWNGTSTGTTIDLPSLFSYGLASAANVDGSVVVGSAGESAAIWSAGAAPMFIPNASALGVSGDGSVVVGIVASDPTAGFRWTLQSGLMVLSNLGTGSGGRAVDISASGGVIAGWCSTNDLSEPRGCTWSTTSTPTRLTNDIAQQTRTIAISGDGRVVVGQVGASAFYWDGTMQLMATRLTALGVNLTGWVLQEATEVSANGKVVVGYGTRNGNGEGWMAVLP